MVYDITKEKWMLTCTNIYTAKQIAGVNNSQLVVPVKSTIFDIVSFQSSNRR